MNHEIEKRRVWARPVTNFEALHQADKWVRLQTMILVERVRPLWNKTTREVNFYLSSLPPNAQFLSQVIRQYWGIENQVHWIFNDYMVTILNSFCQV